MAKAPRKDVTARYLLLGAVLFLSLGGLVMIYSASSASDFVHIGDSAFRVKRQLLYLGAGLIIMWLCSRMTTQSIRRLGPWVLIGSDIGLVLVFLMGVGKWGATRWLDLGLINLQPSEFAKLGCVIMIAGLLADRAKDRRPITSYLGPLALILAPVIVLVMAQPDMGTTMTILVAVFFLLMIGGLEARYLWGLTGAAAVAVPLMILVAPYRMARFLAFLDPWADPKGKGYQIIQGLLAFGSGGLTGVGLGLSRQKFFYLPAAHTDFIFAIIGEELGLAGTLAVILAFALFVWAGMRISSSAPDRFGRLLAGGLTIMIGVQAVMNMAAVTGMMPVTGIPLPLVSSGGSSVLFTLGCVGLILAVANDGRRTAGAAVAAPYDEENRIARTSERRGDGRPHLSVVGGRRSSSRRRA